MSWAEGIEALYKRTVRVLKRSSYEQKLAVTAAVVLFISIFIPWYSNPVVKYPNQKKEVIVDHSAFGNFSLVELALIVIAIFVITIVWTKVEVKGLKLPLRDGTLIVGSGVWAGVLIIYRMLERPVVTDHGISVSYGLQWGVIVSLAAAASLVLVGLRMRRTAIQASGPQVSS